MTPEELIERVMTEHWDMIACSCAFCREARRLGLRPNDGYPTNPTVSILKSIDNGLGYLGAVMKNGTPIVERTTEGGTAAGNPTA